MSARRHGASRPHRGPRDIVVTWPATRSLVSYLDEILAAAVAGREVNFRIARPPKHAPARCYQVHGGQVRGWMPVVMVTERREGEVARVQSDAYAGTWPAGWYVVRRPEFHVVDPIPMRGFQGWRYFNREETR